MKLNYKRTILVGFAFFLISSFWVAYDNAINLILTNKFKIEPDVRGFLLALDNVFAVIMLPIFGALSDKFTKSKFGRRTPFIFVGTLAAAVLFAVLGFIDALPLFIVVLLFCLLAMSFFRSPAVALMPDVTVKPLRSKGNAIINLMGTVAGVIALVLGMIFSTEVPGKTDFGYYMISISVLMLVSLLVFMFTVKEKKWAKEMEEDTVKYGITEKEEENTPKRTLTKPELISLFLILASVALWYMGYNAVTSVFADYATNHLGVDQNSTMIIAQAAAAVAFIPAGIIATKIGRRRTILIGVAILGVSFLAATFITAGESARLPMYVLFATAGIGWATINVNSFPMVVELAKGGDVGRYTGFYYTASMSAQILTPIFSGFLIKHIGYAILFPYAALFVALSFVTMYFVKHGDSKAERVGALEAFGASDD
ncbi:MAG: MFS transporter [Clostridia bacterium]|nr:MFS transporter [Clostridia bacterium]